MSAGRIPDASVLPRWDAAIVRWALSPVERTALTGTVLAGAVDDVEIYRAGHAHARLALAAELSELLAVHFPDEERVRRWLRTPNRGLGGATPIEAMSSSVEWTRRLVGCLEVLS